MFSDTLEERIKGILYSREPWRLIAIDGYLAVFLGKHRKHIILFVDGECQCNCAAWRQAVIGHGGWCRHTIACQRILAALKEGKTTVYQAESAH